MTTRAAIAGALYLDALLTGLARPQVTAATCALLGLAAAGIAGLARSRSERLADGAAGATAFAAPVAVASFAWLAGTPAPVVATLAILVTSAGVALAAMLGTQRAAAAAAVWGAGAAAIGCVLLAVRLPGAGPIEIGLAALTLVAAVVTIVHPPRLPAAAPALATAALIAALARLLAVLVPGIGLVTTTAIVLAVALASRLIPTRLQAGPRLGGEAVSAVIVAGLGGLALVQTAQLAILAWGERVEVLAPFGAQVPVSLLLVAAAGWVLLGRSPDRPRAGSDGIDASLLVASLAGLSAPAALHLAAWSPVVITGAFAAAAGIAAALTRAEAAREVARRRVVGALVLGLWAVAAAGAHPARIALALAGVVAVGLAVAGIARGSLAAPEVAGAALAAALTAAPGAVAGLALATGTGRAGILAWTLAITGIAAVVLTPLRRLGFTHPLPGYGVGAAALSVAGASLIGGLPGAQLWAAGAALVAVAAASALRPPHAAAIITAASLPSALIAVVASAPVWLLTLFGPFRGLGHIWQGPAPMPSPLGAVKAAATLLILAAVAAGIALVLGGWSLDRAPTRPLTSVVVAAVLPPLAAAVLVAPAAFGVPAVVGWVALGVAVLGGLAATLSPPTLPSATSLLRGSAGFTCALAGLAGIAGSLATREGTIVALAIVFAAAGVAGSFGQDPAARTVAWVVAAASGIALPIVAVVAAGATLALACFGVLGTTGLLVAMSWALDNRPRRRREATLVDGLALAGGATALGLTTGAPSYAAAVLTICGVLVGAAAPRRDRTPTQRRWLVWSALGVELAGGFLFLYLAHVRLAEAYTAPFAALAVLAGALELRARPTLSSWIAYGPALAGGFLPSLTLMLVGQDPWWRWVTLFVAATGTVILGTWRRRRAATVTGAIVVLAVAFVQMVRLIGNGQVAGAILLTVGGIVLVTLGAFAERRRPSR